ncbi:hydrogenase expression/formation protein [Bradyrhizobium sp. Tv2a-2]|uniref:hydrogenase expression/formation protein n=1 Tax=Bradyrhizobium sp. Tv2a-2 TaxID=113395 RepID=UPI0004098771|nr:hydrogenase expression/formation protein [Bradyrhizobium sp. Tv2a-2]
MEVKAHGVMPEGTEHLMSRPPIDTESPGPIHAASTATGALAKLSSIRCVELARRCPDATALLSNLVTAIGRQKSDAPNRLFRLGGLDDAERHLIVDVLGNGEVSGVVALPDGSLAQIHESALAGLWRLRIQADTANEYVEVGTIPNLVARAATDLTSPELTIGTAPDGAMNVLPVLTEIRERALAWRPGTLSHIINFTLLPMSPVDMVFLQQTLGSGPIELISRGYGACRILATGIRNVWSVQFFNAMDSIILDTLEVGGIPTSVLAADEDFEDSAERLQKIVEAYFK